MPQSVLWSVQGVFYSGADVTGGIADSIDDITGGIADSADDIAGRIADITAGSGTRSGADGGAGRASGPCGAGGAGGVRVIGRLIANDAVVIINGAIIGPWGRDRTRTGRSGSGRCPD